MTTDRLQPPTHLFAPFMVERGFNPASAVCKEPDGTEYVGVRNLTDLVAYIVEVFPDPADRGKCWETINEWMLLRGHVLPDIMWVATEAEIRSTMQDGGDGLEPRIQGGSLVGIDAIAIRRGQAMAVIQSKFDSTGNFDVGTFYDEVGKMAESVSIDTVFILMSSSKNDRAAAAANKTLDLIIRGALLQRAIKDGLSSDDTLSYIEKNSRGRVLVLPRQALDERIDAAAWADLSSWLSMASIPEQQAAIGERILAFAWEIRSWPMRDDPNFLFKAPRDDEEKTRKLIIDAFRADVGKWNGGEDVVERAIVQLAEIGYAVTNFEAEYMQRSKEEGFDLISTMRSFHKSFGTYNIPPRSTHITKTERNLRCRISEGYQPTADGPIFHLGQIALDHVRNLSWLSDHWRQMVTLVRNGDVRIPELVEFISTLDNGHLIDLGTEVEINWQNQGVSIQFDRLWADLMKKIIDRAIEQNPLTFSGEKAVDGLHLNLIPNVPRCVGRWQHPGYSRSTSGHFHRVDGVIRDRHLRRSVTDLIARLEEATTDLAVTNRIPLTKALNEMKRHLRHGLSHCIDVISKEADLLAPYIDNNPVLSARLAEEKESRKAGIAVDRTIHIGDLSLSWIGKQCMISTPEGGTTSFIGKVVLGDDDRAMVYIRDCGEDRLAFTVTVDGVQPVERMMGRIRWARPPENNKQAGINKPAIHL